jgi:cytochrome c biogenesis protein CcmG, thiol:disulfide interchange protein DsbE
LIGTSEPPGRPVPPGAADSDAVEPVANGEDPDGSESGSDRGGPGGPEAGPAQTPPGPRPRRLRALLMGSLIAAALALFLFVGLGHSSGSGTGSTGPVASVGSKAPGFSLPSLTGGTPVVLDALGKDRHRPVVLNFFASWCIPCQEETPLLARAAAAEKAKGSVVQFVGVDVADPKADAVAFVDKAGLTYPIGADTHIAVAAGLYALDAEPNTFFIDSSGTVVGHKIGALDQAELDRWLHRLAGASG